MNQTLIDLAERVAERVAAETRRHFDEVAGDLRRDFDGLRQEFVGLRQEFVGLRQEFEDLRQQFGGLRQEFVGLRREFDGLRRHVDDTTGDLRGQFDGLRQHVDETSTDLRHYFGIVAESLRDDIRLVAEGVGALSESVDRRFAEFRLEVKEEFSEVRSMIRFSYAELDRRLTTLEKAAR